MPADGPKYDFAQVVAPGTEPKIHSIFDFTAEALEQLAFWLEQRGLHIPITQVLGFSQFQLQYAEVAADETTSSTTYTDLATSGPTLSNLPPGVYGVWYGGKQYGAVGAVSSISVNAAAASDNDSVNGDNTTATVSVGRANKLTLTGESNTIQMKYKAGGAGTVGFLRRYLVALRISSN